MRLAFKMIGFALATVVSGAMLLPTGPSYAASGEEGINGSTPGSIS